MNYVLNLLKDDLKKKMNYKQELIKEGKEDIDIAFVEAQIKELMSAIQYLIYKQKKDYQEKYYAKKGIKNIKNYGRIKNYD